MTKTKIPAYIVDCTLPFGLTDRTIQLLFIFIYAGEECVPILYREDCDSDSPWMTIPRASYQRIVEKLVLTYEAEGEERIFYCAESNLISYNNKSKTNKRVKSINMRKTLAEVINQKWKEVEATTIQLEEVINQKSNKVEATEE